MTHNLSLHQTPSFKTLVQRIVEQAQPEKILLLSACMQRHSPDSIFNDHPVECVRHTHYHLLLLATENEQRSNNALQHIVETQCAAPTSVTVFVLPVQQFNSWLMHSHPFACKVYHKALLCYDAENIPLAIPETVDEQQQQQQLQKEFIGCLQLAAGFLTAAELLTLRQQYTLAAFNLHQVAEQLLTGLLRLYSGLRVHTHNLDKLYRYGMYLPVNAQQTFPRDSEQEKHLFALLQKAYIDSRYSHAYHIKLHELNLLTTRLQKLLQLCQIKQPLTQPIF